MGDPRPIRRDSGQSFGQRVGAELGRPLLSHAIGTRQGLLLFEGDVTVGRHGEWNKRLQDIKKNTHTRCRKKHRNHTILKSAGVGEGRHVGGKKAEEARHREEGRDRAGQRVRCFFFRIPCLWMTLAASVPRANHPQLEGSMRCGRLIHPAMRG